MTMWNNKAGARAALGHISSLAFSDDMSAHLFPFHMMKYDDDVDDTYDDDDEDDDKSEDDYRNVRTFLHRVLSTLGRFGLNHRHIIIKNSMIS